jgi:3-hydroxyacyl-[acyl-carrier-protein] dehydratase
MPTEDDITSLIPHRPPFLWVDTVITSTETTIQTEKTFSKTLDIYEGHYPGNPITPGVILCESVFQSGALLMAQMITSDSSGQERIPVLTRINNAKFKRSVHPGDTVVIKVELKETISSVYFFKGSLKVKGKTAVLVDFACSLVSSTS